MISLEEHTEHTRAITRRNEKGEPEAVGLWDIESETIDEDVDHADIQVELVARPTEFCHKAIDADMPSNAFSQGYECNCEHQRERLFDDLESPPINVEKGEIVGMSGNIDVSDGTESRVTLSIDLERYGKFSLPGFRVKFGSGSTRWGLDQTINQEVGRIAWHPDYTWCAIWENTSGDDDILIYDPTDWTVETTIATGDYYGEMDWSANGNWLAYLNDTGNLTVITEGTWGEETSISAHTDAALENCNFDYGDNYLAADTGYNTSTNYNQIEVREQGNWTNVVATIDWPGTNSPADFSPDGDLFAHGEDGTDGDQVVFRDITNGWGELDTVSTSGIGNGYPLSLAFSPNSQRCAVGTRRATGEDLYISFLERNNTGFGRSSDDDFNLGQNYNKVSGIDWTEDYVSFATTPADLADPSQTWVYRWTTTEEPWNWTEEATMNEDSSSTNDLKFSPPDADGKQHLTYGSGGGNLYIHGVPRATVKVWDGSAFVDGIARVFDGTQWVEIEKINAYDGSSFNAI